MSSERDINDPQYQSWRATVWSRDNGICRVCGAKGDEVHHIVSWAKDPSKRFDISNGIVLCMACHEKTGSYYRHIGQTIQRSRVSYHRQLSKPEIPKNEERYQLENKHILLTVLYWICFVLALAVFVGMYVAETYWIIVFSIILVIIGAWIRSKATKIRDSIEELDIVVENRAEMIDCVQRLARSYPTYTEYNNTPEGYSINYPVDWEVSAEKTLDYFYPNPKVYGYWILGNLCIYYDYLLEDQTLEQLTNNDMNFEAELKTERGEYFRSLENKRLNNDKWQWYISWEDKLFDFIFYHERFYITVGEKYYTVETDGFRDYYDAYRFPKIIESFRLLPNKSDS